MAVTLISPRGLPFDVDDAAVSGFLNAGYRTPTDASDLATAQKRADLMKSEAGVSGAIKAGLEGGASALTFGGSDWIEKGLGVDPEAIRLRSDLHPISHGVGTAVGVIAPLALTGGAAAPEEAASLASRAASATAPSLIGRAGGVVTRALAPEGASIAARVGAKVAGAATEGALVGAGDVVRDAALNPDDVSASGALAHVGESALLGGTAGGLASLAGEGVSALAGKVTDGTVARKLREFAGERGLKAAGGIQSDITKLEKNLGAEGARNVGRELFENDLVGPFTSVKDTAERAAAMKAEVGPKLSGMLERADTLAKPADMVDLGGVLKDLRTDVVAPLAKRLGMESTAERVASLLDDVEERFAPALDEAGGQPTRVSLRQLHELRREIDDLIPYGKEPIEKAFAKALRSVRSRISEEIEGGVERIGADSAEWKLANRKYQIASIAADLAKKGMQRAAGNNLIPLTTLLSGIGGMAAGSLPSGLGVGATAYFARKYGSGILGKAALAAADGDVASRATEQLARFGYGRNVLTQMAARAAPSSTEHGIGAGDHEAALERPPTAVAEAVAPRALEGLLGEDGKGAPVLQKLGSAVSPRLMEVLGDVQAQAYAQAVGAKDDTEVRRLLREAVRMGFGGPFTSAETMAARAQRALLRSTDPKTQKDALALVELARAAQRARVDDRLAPITSDVVGAAWSHGSLAAMGAGAIQEIRARFGPEVAAAIAPSLRRAAKGPTPGLTPPSAFEEQQAQARTTMNAALDELGGEPHAQPPPETVAAVAVLARHADEVMRGVNAAATAMVRGKVPAEMKTKPLAQVNVLRMMDAVRRLASSPDRLVEGLEHHTDTVADHAPQTGQATATTLSAATQYLAAQLPEGRPPSLQDPNGGLPNKAAIASWGRKAQALMQPVETLASGPSADACAALAAVYPQLWDSWRASVVGELASAAAEGKPPPFQTLQRVSTMISQPLVPGQQPAMMAATPIASTPPRAPAMQQTRPSKSGLEKADFGSAMRTGLQETMAGRG